MTKPFLLVQLSDPHIGATWAGGDPVAGLTAAVESVRQLPDPPDAVLMSPDQSFLRSADWRVPSPIPAAASEIPV